MITLSRSRTCDLPFRKGLLYPSELRRQVDKKRWLLHHLLHVNGDYFAKNYSYLRNYASYVMTNWMTSFLIHCLMISIPSLNSILAGSLVYSNWSLSLMRALLQQVLMQ